MKMDERRTDEQKEQIGNELDQIRAYVAGFRVCSAKDEQALAQVLAMLRDVRSATVAIEAAHQRRIQLMEELAKAVADMEQSHRSFAEAGQKPEK